MLDEFVFANTCNDVLCYQVSTHDLVGAWAVSYLLVSCTHNAKSRGSAAAEELLCVRYVIPCQGEQLFIIMIFLSPVHDAASCIRSLFNAMMSSGDLNASRTLLKAL